MSLNAKTFEFLLSQVRASGVALAGGKVYFYAAGTSTPKTVWLDRGKTTPAANPYTLDSNGTAHIFGDGLYRVVIQDSNEVEKYDRDNISIRDISGSVYDVADYASLNAAVAAIGSTPATLQYAADVTVTANLVIPSTLELMPLNGAKINHSTYTVTVNSSTSRWPLTQVFNGTGAISGLEVSRPEWFATNTTPRTTDMTSAVQKAFNASGYVLLSNWYKTTNEITCATAVTVDGAGQGLSGIYAATLGASKSALKFTASGVHLKDFTVEGPASGVYVADETAIYFYGTSGAQKSNATVQSVEIKNFGSYGVLAEYYNNVTVSKSYLHDIGYGAIVGLSASKLKAIANTIDTITPGSASNAYGISFTSRENESVSTEFLADSNIISNIPVWEALDTHGGANGTFSNNVIKGCLIGINLSSADGVAKTAPTNITITGGSIEAGSVVAPREGIIVAGFAGTSIATNVAISNVAIKNMGSTFNTRGSIFLTSTDGVTIKGGTIQNSGTNGVFLDDTNTNFIISTNINGIQPGLATIAGIGLYTANNTGIIDGCNINASAESAIYAWAATSTGVELGKNRLSTLASPKILNGTAFGSGATFSGAVTNDTGSIAALGSVSFTIPVVNSKVGDVVTISTNDGTVSQYLTMAGQVSANGTVVCTLFNPTAAPINPPSATYTAVTVRP